MWLLPAITILLSLTLGLAGGFYLRKFYLESKLEGAKEDARKIIEDAKREAENLRKEAVLKSKEEIYSLKQEVDKEIKERRLELQKLEERLLSREETLDRKAQSLEDKEKNVNQLKEEFQQKQKKLEELIAQEETLLSQISGLSKEQAKELLFKKIEEETQVEAVKLKKKILEQAEEEAEEKSRHILSMAIQRCAADHVVETTVSVVALPSDDIKGRIIGREGRNIRTFENLTGVNLIIDDTPEAVTLSSFDPVRREIARRCLEKLIVDGRIHPAQIEKLYEKAKTEVEAEIRKAGEQALFELSITGVHSELAKALGRLKYRTSYGQNVLQHSIEVANLAGVMAAEIGADVKLAKRAGLLHDIGKAIDQEVEGPHTIIGAELAQRLRESPAVCHAIKAHHEEVEPESIEAVLVQAADAISATRPGARRETLESYIRRLEKLEELAQNFEGVEKCYAIQAGREVRVMVKPTEVDDEKSNVLAFQLARKIEEELDYPGQIKVMVIREHRAVEYAK